VRQPLNTTTARRKSYGRALDFLADALDRAEKRQSSVEQPLALQASS